MKMSDVPGRIVIIGAGHAGVELAAALRHKAYSGTIDLVSDEDEVPYQRPPLSKEYIKRGGKMQALVLKPEQFFSDNSVTLRRGVSAVSVDRNARTVTLSTGDTLAYDHLVFATGARNRIPPVPGLDNPAVLGLRTLADADRLVVEIARFKRVMVIGGGFIGLEAAGLLRELDIEVDVVEMADRLMQRAISPTMSKWFLESHIAAGARVHLNTQVTGVDFSRAEARVKLSDGSEIAADAVILAAGVVPNVELAKASGLAVENGIVVDAQMATADPAVSALGDCAFYPSVHLPGMARLESVQNATDQARALAERLMGEGKPYDALPWFWSIQGAARLQIAGLAKPGLTEVVRGNPADGKFSVFLFDGDRLAAVESVNAPADHMIARRLIARNAAITQGQAADLAFDIKALSAG